MKKIVISLLLMISIVLVGCSPDTASVLEGSYQNETVEDGHFVSLAFYPDDSSFVELIDNRKVDSGTFEKKSDNIYLVKSEKQEFEIILDKDYTFEITLDQLNDGKPFQPKNTSKDPGEIATEFDDVEEYEKLLNKK
ncbi:hypothetical protein SAMN04488700_1642 [Carnobacterium iners]|uniref:Uncharacterized protein n=1 Tax=Carnobacterium iners TaxID=1073423 RepID=A0A1X7N9D9_9LACT|nr:hypothetical protein [Carnobacterium iners]SEK49833.1 hypothetical protein SAMN04488114_1055 [Carnobacterium iners]SMH34164.1 hypothetical protein SAMN04488700_1642 [Carnobacterium iners]